MQELVCCDYLLAQFYLTHDKFMIILLTFKSSDTDITLN